MAIIYTPQYSFLATVSNAGVFSISSLPDFAPGQIISVSGLTSATVSIGAGSIVSISGLTSATVSLSNLPISVKVESLPSLAFGNSVTITNASVDLIASTTSSGNLRVNVVAGGAGDGSILDGSNTAIKASVLSYSNASPLAVRLTDTSGNYIAAGAGTQYTETDTDATIVGTVFLFESNEATSTINPVNNTNSLPVKVSSLPSLAFGQTVTITNGAILSISGLTSAIVSISNLPLQVSGTTIAITSLPDIGLNSSIKVTSLPSLAFGQSVTISQLSLLCTVTAASIFRITSLPALGFGGSVSVSGLTSAMVSLSNMAFYPTVTNAGVTASILASVGAFPVQIIPAKTTFSYTATFTAAQTLLALKAIPGSVTAYYVTDIIVSNENTAGNVRFLESSSNYAARVKIERLYLAANGGAVINFTDGLNWDTNSSIVMTSTTVTNHSVTLVGYTA